MRSSAITLGYQPLRTSVADEIRRQIIDGELAPGERLFEDHLATGLGVSRNPVREALQVLAREGFVEITPRRGTRVGEYSDERARHIFEVRIALEDLVAGLAAERRTASHLAAIDGILAEGRGALRDSDIAALPELNARFHSVLVDATANPVLSAMVEQLILQVRWLYARRVRQRAQWSWEEHAAIAAAVAEGDAQLARRLAVDHVGKARASFFGD